jgi:hypothetical protein
MISQPVHLDFSFPRSYEIKVLRAYSPEAYAQEELHQFPAKLEEGDRTGAYLRVLPQGKNAWIGFFALGFNSDQVVTAVYSCPSPDLFCAVIGGYGYMVHAADPNQWMQIEQRPIVDVRVISELRMLLFTGFTSITAFGAQGHLWTTERLSWEGVSISRVEDGRAEGFGWDASGDKEVPFTVDLKTGRHEGGARPGGTQDRQ